MSRKYNLDKNYTTISEACKEIIQRYNINDRDLENKIYRKILEYAHNGYFDAQKYKDEKSRMWILKKDVINEIESIFNLSSQGSSIIENVSSTTPSYNNSTPNLRKNSDKILDLIQEIVSRTQENILSKDQCFEIISNILKNNN